MKKIITLLAIAALYGCEDQTADTEVVDAPSKQQVVEEQVTQIQEIIEEETTQAVIITETAKLNWNDSNWNNSNWQ